MAKRRHKKNQRYAGKKDDSVRIDFREVGKLFAVAALVIAGIWGSKQIESVAIKAVVVQSSLQKVDKSEIRNIAEQYMQEGFFTVDLGDFEQQLNDLPWVYRANIQRQWPGKLIIEIKEQAPYFRWGSEALLNAHMEIFKVNDLIGFENLPMLEGVEGREEYLVRFYHQYSARFNKVGAAILELKEDARYDKVIRLANGIDISVGRENAEQQLERCLQSFAMFSKAEREAIASIDLRHSNGFAIRWDS